MNNRLLAIDGNSLINRAYYAIQKPMITREGLYTQGVYGFLNMLTKIKKRYDPAYMVVAFDKKAPTFRHKEYEQYKAGRKKMPPELSMQMPLLKEVLSAMNIKIMEMDGFEADDIIGTVAKRAESEGLRPIIITGDKDELQLASDKTRVILTKKGISEFEEYDEEEMIKRYGFTPVQFIDYKGMMGDASDNIPGIPGVGEKTAMLLMQQFGSVESMLERSDEIKNEKLRNKIIDNAQLAMMSKRLATIFTDVPISFSIEECRMGEPNYEELINIYIKLEFNSMIPRLNLKTRDDNKAKKDYNNYDVLGQDRREKHEGFDISTIKRHTIETVGDFRRISDKLGKQLILKVFHDANHKGKVNVYGICLLSTDIFCFLSADKEPALIEECFDFLRENDIKISGHLLQSDYYSFFSHCLADKQIFDIKTESGGIFNTGFDTAIAEYLIEPSRSKYSLSTMSVEYLKSSLDDEREVEAAGSQIDMFSTQNAAYEEYGFDWCVTVMRLIPVLTSRIRAENLQTVLEEIELPLIEVMAVMEYHGFSVDSEELRRIGDTLTDRLKTITEQIYEIAGEEFNINSPKQLGPILFEKLELPAGKKTKTGYATGAEVLEKLIDHHEIIPLILEYRMLSKLNSTYVEGLIPLIGSDGRIRAHFNQTVTTTGRISCTEPNLQNIPIRQELGRTLRKAFTTGDRSYVLMGADYSQIELRVLAHLSQDKSLLDAFIRDDDIHRITASKVFDVPEEEVTPEQRSRAKVVNFGVIYGMSQFGLATDLSITRKEAGRYIDEYFKKYVTVKNYLDSLVLQCKNNGYVTTIKNRKRHIPEIHASSYMARQLGERLAMNTPIQGSAADIIKMAMVKVQRALMKAGMRTKLILQVHDELVLEVPEDELSKAKELLTDNMQTAIELRVPLVVTMNTGGNWYELK